MSGSTHIPTHDVLDWTQIRRIAWKDHRRISGLAYALFAFWAICFLYVIATTFRSSAVTMPWSIFEVLFCISATSVIYAVGWAGITFASEHEDKTYPYLTTLPVTGKTVFYGKLYYGVISTLALMCALGILGCLHWAWLNFRGGSLAKSSMQDELIYSSLLTASLIPFAFAVGMFWSMRIKRPLLALTVAGLCLGLLPTIAVLLAGGIIEAQRIGHEDLPEVWLCMAIISLFAAVFFFLARRLAPHWLPTTAPGLLRGDATSGRDEHHGSNRLFWLQKRQSLMTNLGLGGIAIALAAIPMEITKMAALAILGILGVLTFRPEYVEDRYRLLAQFGVKPGQYWRSRLLIPGMFVLCAAAFFAFSWSGYNRYPMLLFFGCVSTFAFGQFFSSVCKSTVIACALTLAASILVWGFIFYCAALALPLPFVGLVAVLPFLASYLRIPSWFRDNERWQRWIMPATPMVLLFVGLPLAAIAYRVYEIPSVDLPQEFAAFGPQNIAPVDKEFTSLANSVSLDEIKTVVQSLKGSKANFGFEVDNANRLSSRFLSQADRVHLRENNAGAKWDYFASALDIAALFNNGNSGLQGAKVAREIESRVYERLAQWANLESNDAEQITAAAEYINDLRDDQATWQAAMAGTYAIGETYPANSRFRPATNRLLRDYDSLMPWENVRAARFRNHNYALEYYYHTSRDDQALRARDLGRNRVDGLNERATPIYLSDAEVDSFDTIEIKRRMVIYQLVATAYHKEHGEYPKDFEKITLNGKPLPWDFHVPGRFMALQNLGNGFIAIASSRDYFPLPKFEAGGEVRLPPSPPALPDPASPPDSAQPAISFDAHFGNEVASISAEVAAINEARNNLLNSHLMFDGDGSPKRPRQSAYSEALEQISDHSELDQVKQLLRKGTDSQRTQLIRRMSGVDPHWVADVVPELTEIMESEKPEIAGVVAQAFSKALSIRHEHLFLASSSEKLDTADIEKHIARTYAEGQPETPNVPVKNAANGHYYELLTPDTYVQKEEVHALAANRRFRGMTGHLVTITSKQENDFLSQAFGHRGEKYSPGMSQREFAWTAGVFDMESETWSWSDGPEKGEIFWPQDEDDDEAFADWILTYFGDSSDYNLVWLLAESPKRWLWSGEKRAPAVLIEYSVEDEEEDPPLEEAEQIEPKSTGAEVEPAAIELDADAVEVETQPEELKADPEFDLETELIDENLE